MLTRLKIQNLILVENADIHFGEGLNILTGETGAGKSAILSAIQLIAGGRADTHLIGQHKHSAIVDAEIDNMLVRRELYKSGKSRCFIDDAQVSLATLKETIGNSISLIDQSRSRMLSSIDEQRKMLDAFADTKEILASLRDHFATQQQMEKSLETLLQASETRSRDLCWMEEDLALIEKTNWKETEEKELSLEHNLLTHAQELGEKMDTLSSLFKEQSLKKAANILEGCARLDPKLLPLTESLKIARLEVEEIQRSIDSYLSELDADPRKLDQLEERIAEIEQLKRRFGKTFASIEEKKTQLQEKIHNLNNLDLEVTNLNTSLSEKKKETLSLAHTLSRIRKKRVPELETAVIEELKSLNLPHAKLQISMNEGILGSNGIDTICFLFSANPGHPPIPVEECASGGELSRLLLAMKTILAEKESPTCLIFDEIDSNVGGQTASALGEKLKTIGKKRQVICVTHFVQVARCANTHFVVTKKEEEGMTSTSISKLETQERPQEYQRMLGRSEILS